MSNTQYKTFVLQRETDIKIFQYANFATIILLLIIAYVQRIDMLFMIPIILLVTSCIMFLFQINRIIIDKNSVHVRKGIFISETYKSSEFQEVCVLKNERLVLRTENQRDVYEIDCTVIQYNEILYEFQKHGKKIIVDDIWDGIYYPSNISIRKAEKGISFGAAYLCTIPIICIFLDILIWIGEIE